MGLVARYPYLSLLLILFVLAAPAVLLARPGRGQRFLRGYLAAILGIVGMLTLARAAVFLVRLRPAIEGVDFYNYLCVARDVRHGATDLSEWRYAYFPGVYTFWRVALMIGGETLGGVQWVYATLLAANGILLGVTVWRAVKSWLGGVLCAVGYVALVARLEGGYGVAEPIAMLPLAATVAIWAGEPLRGRRGLMLAAMLGAGFGLAAYVKQQGALQAAGWLALPLTSLFAPPDRRHERRAMAVVPVTAALVFTLGILAEGHGLFPLRMGVRAVISYSAHSSFLTNLEEMLQRIRPLALAVLLTIPAGAIALWRIPQLRGERWFGVAMFALFAALATFYQFTKRGYLHYALLSAPWLLLASVSIAAGLWQSVRWRDSIPARFAVLLVFALPLVHDADPASDTFFLWPPVPISVPSLGHWRLQEIVADDFHKLEGILHRGEDVMVLPPRHDEIHFLLGTRSVSWAQGYNWGFEPSPAATALESPKLAAVIVLSLRDSTDDWTWNWHNCDQVLRNLRSAGFHSVAQLKTLSVWRRN